MEGMGYSRCVTGVCYQGLGPGKGIIVANDLTEKVDPKYFTVTSKSEEGGGAPMRHVHYIGQLLPKAGFPNLFGPRSPFLDNEHSTTPKHLSLP